MSQTHTPTRRARYCVPTVTAAARNSVPYAVKTSHRRKFATSLLLLSIFGLTGCATTSSQPLATAGQAKQVILCAVKPDVDAATVLSAANDFAKLPAAQDVSAGYDPQATKTVKAAPTKYVTFILSFRDEAAMVRTLSDTQYIGIRDQQLKPLCSELTTYQTTLQNYQVADTYRQETTAADLQRRAAAIQKQNELRGQTK